jgi:integrase
MGRKRQAKNRMFPPNLYQNSAGYFYYRHPINKKLKGLGRDKASAFNEARAANDAIAAMKPTPLADWATGKVAYTLKEWLPIYKELWLRQSKTPPAANTLRGCVMYLKKIEECPYAWMKLPDVQTLHVAAHLQEAEASSGAASALALRARLGDVFRMAETQGLISHGSNPVKATYTPDRTVARERLSLEQFLVIREAGPIWLKRAMNLALVTGQRREDITLLKYADYHDGHLHVVQGKGRGTVRLRLDGSIRLNAVGMSIADAIQGCKDMIVSRYMVHHVEHIARVHPGDKIMPNGLSNAFTRAREACGIVAEEGRTPPTFHEIRSLSERLYRAECGADFAQAILGHKHASMTAKYDDLRGQGWDVVEAKIL